MGSSDNEQPDKEPPVADFDEPVKTEYLDLDDDGVLDAVRTTETLEYETSSGADVVEEIRELDAGIGPDGTPTTVTVTDMVTIDTDHDGAPHSAAVTTVTIHPPAAPGAS